MTDGQFHLDPPTYVERVRAAVPAYDALHEAVASAGADLAVERVLDLGTGTGEAARRALATHRRAALVAVDASPEMVALATAAFPGHDVREARLQDALPTGTFDLVTSVLAVHHLGAEEKQDLFRRIAGHLAAGGRFVLGDVIVPEDPSDAVTPLEPSVDRPDSLADQLAWLIDAGLAPQLVWRDRDLVVIAADLAT